MMASPGRKYFGDVDASSEDMGALTRQFVGGALLERVVGPNAPDGAEIVVGIKGTGKTALGRMVTERFSGTKWFRSEKSYDSRFEVPATNLRSGVLMGMIKLFIIEQFVEELSRQGHVKQSDFEKWAKPFKNIFMRAAKSAEINAPFIKIKPAEFFSIDNQEDARSAWDSAIKLLIGVLGDKSGLIVLDDVDTYFVGLENYPRFIEGLCRAVTEINSLHSPKIYCLLLLKQGVWRTLFEKPEEYDKIKHSMEFLSWDLLGCTSVLCNRIALIHEKPTLEINSLKDGHDLLELEFDGNLNTITKCVEEVFSYSVNGPRDVIDLCNNIRRQYPAGKITTAMVSERVTRFSEEKLYALNGDFGHIYPDIPELIQGVFQGFKVEFTGVELRDRLDAGILNDPKSKQQDFGKHSWFRSATTESFLKKFFDVGVIGIARPNREALFAKEDNALSQNVLLNSQLLLHRAYQPALGFA